MPEKKNLRIRKVKVDANNDIEVVPIENQPVIEEKPVEKKPVEKKPVKYLESEWKKKQTYEYVKKQKKPENKDQQSKLKYKKLPAGHAPVRVKGGKLGVIYKGKPTNYVMFKKGKKDLNLDMVRDFTTNVSIALYNKGKRGKISVSINFGGRIGWRSGYFTDIGLQRTSVYDMGDSDRDIHEDEFQNIQEFSIYVLEDPEKSGGNDLYNDCLYNCLKEVMGKRCPYGFGFDMKEHLNLKRNDKVPIELINKVDEYLGNDYKLTVSGDYTYNSTKKSKYEIRLKLLEGHYSIDRDDRVRINKYLEKTKRPIFYIKERNKKEKKINYTIYDGKNKKTLTDIEFKEFKEHKPYDCMILEGYQEFETVEESYNYFIKMAEELKKETNGIIDMYKTGTYVDTALKLFDDKTKHIYSEKIEQNEGEWIESAMISAVIYAKKGYKGPAYKYDYNSMYGSLMIKKEFLIPIKKGSFESIKELPEILKYGIYNVEIEKNEEETFFRYNKDNKYTHIDIYIARKLGLGVKLFIYENNEPNALIYERDCLINSNWLFDDYIMEMFKLKQKKIPGAKQIGNCLWGALCQKNYFQKVMKVEENYELPKNTTIYKMNPLDEDNFKIDYCYNHKVFNTNYARLGPFLLAKGRELIIKTAILYKDNVKRIHTDSITSDIKLPFIHSTDIGQLKYEGYCEEIEIINKNCVKGEFKV